MLEFWKEGLWGWLERLGTEVLSAKGLLCPGAGDNSQEETLSLSAPWESCFSPQKEGCVGFSVVKISLFPFKVNRIEFTDFILSSLAPDTTPSFHCFPPLLFVQPGWLCAGKGNCHAPVAKGTQ